MKQQPREVDLPVCDLCDLVGKRTAVEGVVNHYCSGPPNNTHRRVRLKTRLFREVVDA